MKRSACFALILVYAAMLAASWVSSVIFDRLPHLEDEIAYLYQARIFDHGEAYIPIPEPRRAFWQPFVIDCTRQMDERYDLDCEGKRFGKYTPGWSLVLAFGTANKVPWIINVWLAGLVVALVYRIGREMYDETAGVAAALLMTISPIALLLNGSLMGHTVALFFTLLFVYGLWRIEQKRRVLWWGALAGFALGMLIATRPLSAIGIAAPLILYSGLRLLWILIRSLWAKRSVPTSEKSPAVNFFAALNPLLMVALFTLIFGALYPGFNYAVAGNPTANLYRLQWDYDRVGFGDDYGRNGHTLEEGLDTAQKDLACYSRDLFGWVEQPDKPPTTIETKNECLVDRRGLSPALLLPGLLLMRRRTWSLLLLALAGGLIAAHLAYWIGAGVYSARYYFEATGALALVSGAGISGLARIADHWRLRSAVYALLGIVVAASLIGYTPERLHALEGYGCINQSQIQQVERLRTSPDIPVLVIAYGEQNGCKGSPSWRDMGTLMGVTDPYTDYDVIMLRDLDQSYVDQLLALYPDRQVLYMLRNRIFPAGDNRQPPTIAP